MAFSLTDDGTMDTVVRCDECGEQVRFSPDGADDADLKPCCALCIPEGCPNCYDAYVDECCNDAAENHECPIMEDPNEPDDDALTTEDHRRFYQYSKLAFKLEEFNDAYVLIVGERQVGDTYPTVGAAIQAYMKHVQFWPDVWFISDHGNAHRIEL